MDGISQSLLGQTASLLLHGLAFSIAGIRKGFHIRELVLIGLALGFDMVLILPSKVENVYFSFYIIDFQIFDGNNTMVKFYLTEMKSLEKQSKCWHKHVYVKCKQKLYLLF